jgi:tetratricopeptide (TPR) repeat protein
MEHFPLQFGAFVVLFLLVIVLAACTSRLARLLRERHADRLEELGLGDLHDESSVKGFGVPRSVITFLQRRRYRRLRDYEVVRLAESMRWIYYAYMTGFVLLFASVLYDGLAAQFGPRGRYLASDSAETDGPVSPEQALRERAHELQQARRHAQAIAIYDELIRTSANDAGLLYARGYSRQQAGRLDEALVDYRRVLDLAPGNVDAYNGANVILLGQKRYDDCLDLWNRYLRFFPGDKVGHYERSRAHFLRGDPVAAQSDAQRSCDLGEPRACPAAAKLKARSEAATK